MEKYLGTIEEDIRTGTAIWERDLYAMEEKIGEHNETVKYL